MSHWINNMLWLTEVDNPGDLTGMPPGQDPAAQLNPTGPQDAAMPLGNDAMPADQDAEHGDEDISGDPQFPDMPGVDEEQSFESWRIDFFKESIKGDPNVLMEMLSAIRNSELESHQRKFVEDNYEITLLRQHQDILIPSKKIRHEIKTQLDQNSPGTTLMEHLAAALEATPMLNEIYVKLKGAGGGRSDYHRKFLASLMGAVQVGNGKANEDLIFEDREFSIRISTRFGNEWGNVFIGPWTLKEDDPKRYLKSPELDRLESGSPEEKDVLKRRVIMDSIAQMFQKRAFLIDVVGEDGTITHVGLDLGNCLRAAYIDGRLVVRTDDSDNRDAFIDDEGSIISIPSMRIQYIRASDQLGDHGDFDMEELDFIKHDNGMLRLVATGELLKEASSVLQGLIVKEIPFNGNPTDLLALMRSVPSVPELLLSRRY